MRNAWAWLVGFVTLMAGCSSPPDGPATPTPTDAPGMGPQGPDGTLRFAVVGDTGSGDENQVAVAQAMAEVCLERGCAFVLINGDNIYEDGVSSPTDPQFETKFEDPFSGLDLPFWLVLGNHDNGDGAGSRPEMGDHQVAYHYRTDRTSDRWHMPARNYVFTAGPARFLGLDSGPEEVAQPPAYLAGSRGQDLSTFLAGETANGSEPWRFAFAHHPYVSNGPHGNAGLYDLVPTRGLAYKQALEDGLCGRVDVFFAGHDHALEWLEPVDACSRTHFIISGAGSQPYSVGNLNLNPVRFQAFDTLGFVWVEVTATTFTAAFYDAAPALLFEGALSK